MKYNILEVFLLNIIFLVRRIQKEFQKKLRLKYFYFFYYYLLIYFKYK